MNKFPTTWTDGRFNIEYSLFPPRIAIDDGHRFIEVVGSEPVTIFCFFTDELTDMDAITKYFDADSEPLNC